MYAPLEGLVPPEPTETLWRYTDLAGLISLLETGSLHFCRLDKFADPYDGYIPHRHFASKATMASLVLDHGFFGPFGTGLARRHARASKELQRFRWVNCWHLSEQENFAMWKIYSGEDKGIALETTFEGFCEALSAERETAVHIGKMSYINPDTEDMPEHELGQLFWKSHAYEYEKEVRAVVCADPDFEGIEIPKPEDRLDLHPEGWKVKVDLGALVTRLHVSPFAPDWYAELVQQVVARYKLDSEVVQSKLTRPPNY